MEETLGRPRTAEEFDQWFHQSGGDPWNYSSTSIQARLKASRDFLCCALRNDFEGTILELGAFDGSFTVLIRGAFPLADICVIDISTIAIEKAQRKVGHCQSVRYYVQDLLETTRERLRVVQDHEVVILMLECLYYLKEPERAECIEIFRREFPKSLVVISVPVTGGHYFTEASLLQLFRNAKYTLRDFKILNLKRRIPIVGWFLEYLAQHISPLRSILANQVIFVFAPE